MKSQSRSLLLVIALLFSNFVALNQTHAAGAEASVKVIDWPIPINSAEYPEFHSGPGVRNMIVVPGYGPINTLPSGIKCRITSDPKCIEYAKKFPGQTWGLLQHLGFCSTEVADDSCIENFQIYQDGKPIPMKKIGVVPVPEVPAARQYGIPQGFQPTLWQDPSQTDSNIGYMLVASQNVKGTFLKANPVFYGSNIEIARYIISPDQRITAASAPAVGITGNFADCLWVEIGKCAHRIEMDDSLRFKLILRLSGQYTGWFSGRLTNSSIKVISINSRNNQISIEGSPIHVPYFAASAVCGSEGLVPCANAQFIYTGHEGNSSFIDEPFVAALKNRAMRDIPLFKLESSGQTKGAKCKYTPGKVAGVATSNATLFPVSAPIFSNNSLNYQLAAMHYSANGEVFYGNYDLILESNYAKCLWNLKSLTPQAQITVIGQDGSKTISTVATSIQNGYFYLHARGFTFSSPTISVKLI